MFMQVNEFGSDIKKKNIFEILLKSMGVPSEI